MKISMKSGEACERLKNVSLIVNVRRYSLSVEISPSFSDVHAVVQRTARIRIFSTSRGSTHRVPAKKNFIAEVFTCYFHLPFDYSSLRKIVQRVRFQVERTQSKYIKLCSLPTRNWSISETVEMLDS